MEKLTGPRTATRLFVIYACVSLIPVAVLGLVMASAFRSEATTRGLAVGRSQAALVARTAVEPLLSGRPLSDGLTSAESSALRQVAAKAVGAGDIVRFRLRDLSGKVVFSDDGSGFNNVPDDEVADAAQGAVVASLTHLNSDTNDTGPVGTRVVEVYRPLEAGASARRVGVLEIYLPYAPIAADVAAGIRTLYWDLTLGLGLLYVLLAGISLSVTRRLRRHAVMNAYLAEHDTLTGLPNRTLFHRRVEEALAASARGRQASCVVAVIDLDRFKEVNDTLGHHNGDQVLIELGRRLAAAVGPRDTVARLGGDEFGIVLRDAFRTTEAIETLERLRAAIEHDLEVQGLPLLAEASIGFAVAPADGADVDTLLQHADVAMYVAKAGAMTAVRYDGADDHYNPANLAVVAELRHALANDELVLHYQPQVSILTGETVAVEALVRWQHPERGLLYPDLFLPIAEQTGLIEPLTAWVLQQALEQLRDWGSAADGLALAVNVSARSLADSSFADRVLAALARAGLPAERLLIEVTETALLTDPERATVTLSHLDRSGVRISLDDFGRGQTSLGYLAELPLHELKIDKGFVMDMLQAPAHSAIVASVIGLAHNLGLHVVAEGIEDQATLTELLRLGCDIAQGYLIARPMPADQVGGWLMARQLVVAGAG